MKKRLLALGLVGAAASLLLAPPAQAATANVYTAAFTFVPATVPINAGDSLSLTNGDLAAHNLISRECVEFNSLGGCKTRLFASANAGFLQTKPVQRVESLAAGQYGFYCSFHPFMEGTLVVS